MNETRFLWNATLMPGLKLSLLAGATAAWFSGCASSSGLSNMWRDPSFESEPMQDVLVVAIKKHATNRRLWEDGLVVELGKYGVNSTPSYRLFPNALPDTAQVVDASRRDRSDSVLAATVFSQTGATQPQVKISEDRMKVFSGEKVLLDGATDGFMSVHTVRHSPDRKYLLVIGCGYECNDNVGRDVWVPVKYQNLAGWVNQTYLYEEAPAAEEHVIKGTVTYRERVALLPGAILKLSLVDVSRADAAAVVISSKTITPQGSVPIPFELSYDPLLLEARHTYAVQARLESGGKLWVSTQQYRVLAPDSPETVEIVVQAVK
jgi:putative lipoprotein